MDIPKVYFFGVRSGENEITVGRCEAAVCEFAAITHPGSEFVANPVREAGMVAPSGVDVRQSTVGEGVANVARNRTPPALPSSV